MYPQNYTMNILIGLSNIFKKNNHYYYTFQKKAIFAILITTN